MSHPIIVQCEQRCARTVIMIFMYWRRTATAAADDDKIIAIVFFIFFSFLYFSFYFPRRCEVFLTIAVSSYNCNPSGDSRTLPGGSCNGSVVAMVSWRRNAIRCTITRSIVKYYNIIRGDIETSRYWFSVTWKTKRYLPTRITTVLLCCSRDDNNIS